MKAKMFSKSNSFFCGTSYFFFYEGLAVPFKYSEQMKMHWEQDFNTKHVQMT